MGFWGWVLSIIAFLAVCTWIANLSDWMDQKKYRKRQQQWEKKYPDRPVGDMPHDWQPREFPSFFFVYLFFVLIALIIFMWADGAFS